MEVSSLLMNYEKIIQNMQKKQRVQLRNGDRNGEEIGNKLIRYIKYYLYDTKQNQLLTLHLIIKQFILIKALVK